MSDVPSPGQCLAQAEPHRLRLTMVNDSASIGAGQASLREFLRGIATADSSRFHAELAFEELVTNIVHHAYAGVAPSSRRIDAELVVDATDLRLCVEDDGPPFDPAQAAPAALPASVAQAAVGGLGIRFIRAATTRLTHERIADRNRTTAWLSR